MSNSPIYEEFRKKVGKNPVRNSLYVRTQCKNCSKIIEYEKSKQKNHKGYCVKCKGTETRLELIGKKFTHLTVINRVNEPNNQGVRWLCKCTCGGEVIATSGRLVYGSIKSCGCVHGMSEETFLKNNVEVDKETGCWNWTGTINKGYGRFKIKGKMKSAHRSSWEIHFGEIPAGFSIGHHCDNRKCIRPQCLFLCKPHHNSADMVRKNRQAYGSKNAAAKTNEEQVVEIKKLLKKGFSQAYIANMMQLSTGIIRRISSGETWCHVHVPIATQET